MCVWNCGGLKSGYTRTDSLSSPFSLLLCSFLLLLLTFSISNLLFLSLLTPSYHFPLLFCPISSCLTPTGCSSSLLFFSPISLLSIHYNFSLILLTLVFIHFSSPVLSLSSSISLLRSSLDLAPHTLAVTHSSATAFFSLFPLYGPWWLCVALIFSNIPLPLQNKPQ